MNGFNENKVQPNNNDPSNQGESNYAMNCNNNPFRQFKLSETQGFIGLQDMLADADIVITDKVIQYKGETLIVLGGQYKLEYGDKEVGEEEYAYVSVNMLLGYGEGTIIHCSMNWWTHNGEFVTWDHEYSSGNNVAWPSKLHKEVELLVSSDSNDYSPALEGQSYWYGTPYDINAIKWIQLTFELAQKADNHFRNWEYSGKNQCDECRAHGLDDYRSYTFTSRHSNSLILCEMCVKALANKP